MRHVAWLMVLALALGMTAFASEKVSALDGTSWKIDVDPDSMSKAKGEKQYNEILTFADGFVSMTEGQKVGFASSAYEVTKSGEKNWTFKTSQENESTARTVWTGTIHEENIEGKLIMTKKGGSILTYTFKGNQPD